MVLSRSKLEKSFIHLVYFYSENGKFPFEGCYNISISSFTIRYFQVQFAIFFKLNSFMATQTKDELYFSPHAYLSTCNAVTIISSLYICTSSRKRPKYLFPPSIKIRYVFLVKEIRLLYEFRIPVSATDFANFLVFLYYFSYSWFTVSHFLLQLKKENEKKG